MASLKVGIASVLVLMACCGALQGAEVVEGAASCSATLTGLRTKCANYVMGAAPPRPALGSDCCQVIKSASLPCVCNNIPPGVLGLLNRPAILAAISSCGLKLPRGTRCAGMTYPGN
ncbi:hypothetical protein GOP47_0030711 [Adiantum capillus-veneris]|nr:hypothetical protein GOP47_0030711 [Adiantum capillus-veneris]